MENILLKLFRYLTTLLILISLIAFAVLIFKASNNWLQKPVEPSAAKKAVIRDIKTEDLLRFLAEREQASQTGESQKKMAGMNTPSLRYQEEATTLFRCAGDFGKLVGEEVAGPNDQENAARLQQIRVQIERFALSSSLHGEAWVRAVTEFTCKSLENSKVIELRSSNKVKQVFFPMLEFHHRTWGAVQREKADFDRMEEQRVVNERSEDNARIVTAKATAIAQAYMAAGAIAAFMAFALYLIIAKVERNLGSIAASLDRANPISSPAKESN